MSDNNKPVAWVPEGEIEKLDEDGYRRIPACTKDSVMYCIPLHVIPTNSVIVDKDNLREVLDALKYADLIVSYSKEYTVQDVRKHRASITLINEVLK